MNHTLDVIINDIANVRCLPELGAKTTTTRFIGNHTVGTYSSIASTGPIGSAWEAIQTINRGLTIEVWFRSPARLSSFDSAYSNSDALDSGVILMIGQGNHSASSALTTCDKKGLDFQILQRSDYAIEITYRTSDPYFEACQSFQYIDADLLTADTLVHLVLSMSDMDQKLYINGHEIVSLTLPFFNNLSHWNVVADEIHMIHYSSSSSADVSNKNSIWEGVLYEITFHAGMSSPNKVIELLRVGLPKIKDFVFNHTLTINEDAEASANTHSYEWYFQERTRSSDDVAQLQGPIVASLNLDVFNLWKDAGIAPLASSLPQSYVYLTDIPHIGRLFTNDGNLLERTNETPSYLVLIGSVPVKSLIYIPPHNFYSTNSSSTFTQLSYCVSSRPIFDVTQCESSASVEVVVRAVNDPPSAVEVSPVSVIEGKSGSRIPLLGDDVDENDYILVVHITKSPDYGTLTLCVLTFRNDGQRHGMLLSDLNNTIYGPEPVYVNYEWNPNTPVASTIQGQAVKDYFMFRVQDSVGAWSSEHHVEVRLMSSIHVQISGLSFDVYEDTDQFVTWIATDTVGYRRKIQWFIEKVPSAEIGIFRNTLTNETIQAGSIVASVSASSQNQHYAPIIFRPHENFCHSKTNQNILDDSDVVTLRAVGLSNDDQLVVSASDTVSQKVRVSCIIDELSMIVPSTSIIVIESSLENIATESCYKNNLNESDKSTNHGTCHSTVHIDGIQVTSPDRRTEKAYVIVSTFSGYLTFNSKYWDETVDPITGRKSMSSGNVSFRAYPDDLSDIFSRLAYGTYSSIDDSLLIEIHYGNCTANKSAKTSFDESVTMPNCQILKSQIPIVVLKNLQKYTSQTRIVVGFPWQVALCCVGYPLLYIVVVFLCNNVSTKDLDETAIVSTIAASPEFQLERWIQHRAENGMFYYENTEDGTVTWQVPPPSEDFIRRPSEEP